MEEARRYIRHPSDIPLEIYAENTGKPVSDDHLRDISHGGLAFKSRCRYEVNHAVRVRFPTVDPQFETKAIVVWCKPNRSGYDVGVEFRDKNEAYRLRLVEQICHIEQYRLDMQRTRSRALSSEEAAQEWIRRYARNFPIVWKS